MTPPASTTTTTTTTTKTTTVEKQQRTSSPARPPTYLDLPRQNSGSVITGGVDHHIPSQSCFPETRAVSPSATAQSVGPFIIGVTGASASGKTTVCEKIINGLGDQRCVLVSLDWFYHGLPSNVDAANYNFDHPNAFDYAALKDTLKLMSKRAPVRVPMYDFTKHQRSEENAVELDVADVIIVEGILTFYDRSIREMMHMKVFVDEDADVCLSRRIIRDAKNRGRSVDSVLERYARYVKPAFQEFILPTKRYADIVVPRGVENVVAIDLIIKHIALKIRQEDLRKIYFNLMVMSDSYQARGLHTIIREETVDRNDFVFYSNRLMRLLIEEGLGLLPFERKTVTTPLGGKFYGVGFVAGLAAISVMPAGECMESSLRAVCNTLRIGKMLVGDDGEMLYESLPEDVQRRHVLILAPVLDRGEKCAAVVQRLVNEVGCEEDRLMVLCLIASPQAIGRLCGQFGKLSVVVSCVDQGVDCSGRVYPGIGEFATRYFGCD